MGNNCSGQCVICRIMCLAFPIGTCWLCNSRGSQGNFGAGEEAVKINIDDIRKAYDKLASLHPPHEFCDMLYGTFHNEPTPTCTIDLSNSEDFLKDVVGIDTPEQLCTQVDGKFVNANCTLDVAQCGQAAFAVKEAACSSLGGVWSTNSCALIN